MPSTRSPVVAGWELARRLRVRRDQEEIDVNTITRELGFSRNYWSAVENERKILSEESLVKLMGLLNFNAQEQQELLDLRLAAKERGWWAQYSGLLDSDYQRMYGLEAGARTIRTYESLLIPGLLQTAEYAGAIMKPAVTVRRVDVEQRVQVRMLRQKRLTGEDPLQFGAIISEAALRQQIGGPAVLRGQLVHLVTMLEDHPENIDLRVIPFTATACGLFGAATVHLMDFENTWLPTVAWHETVTVGGIIDNPKRVTDIAVTYQESLGQALGVRESLELIQGHIKELA